MSSKLYPLYAFLGGAIVGAGAALLFAPEKGSETRSNIANFIRRKCPLLKNDKVEEVVDEIEEIIAQAKK